MKTRRIDVLLKMLENHAGEALAETLDTHPDYQAIVHVLTEMEFGYVPTWSEKMDCYTKLRCLFLDFDMNYEACLARVIEAEKLWEEN